MQGLSQDLGLSFVPTPIPAHRGIPIPANFDNL